ncbi:hypothetical protein L1987_03378 [Smallanthus sonchifolius]|uniref:Uncharacterized protein n=1 Tax=Smallanthus sonchifolius TaxID=185202 RepID=A0ACB9KAH0_9ASTR|nr:hypothetical protein L1987_03378 [Smallanthus sonchifolius]
MWLPPGYTESKDKYSHDPVSVKHHESSKRGGNGEGEQGGGNRFPFQIFWLPSKNDQVGKEHDLDLVANKGLSDTNNNEGSGSEGERETGNKHVVQKVKQASTNKEETRSKHAVQKVIPVMQAITNEENKNLKSIDTMVNSDSMEKTDNGSRASPKASKLPPVCLRIDPLPRKKKSSRSPSPGEKGRSNGAPINSPEPSPQQAQVLKKSKEEQSEGNIKTVDHANKVERDTHEANVPRGEGDESEKGRVEEVKNLSEHANKVEQDSHGGNEPRGKGDENEKEKKNLSEHEAALIIQSVYRGFEVRKSQPLKKLRKIYEVRKQVFELRNRIQDLESSSCTDGKKQVIIGETIMSLLLKLDTIQGLHPFVREARKSVAKELVGLQEKLDSLSFVKSETPTESLQQNEDDVIQGKNDQAQSKTSSCENHATESQYDDDAEASILEQQLVKSTGIQDKEPTICENQEVESQEGFGESHKEKFNQAPTECDEAMGMCATESQEGCDEQQLEDQAPTENDEALGSCENQEMESTESQNTIGEQQMESDKEKSDQECDEACENQEVEATESQEGFKTVQVELEKEKFHQAPTGSDDALGLGGNQEVGATKSQEGIGEPQLELDQAATECDEAVGLCENHATESREGCGEPQLELHKEKLEQECDDTPGLCESHEVKATDCVDNDSQELNNNRPVESEVHVDNSIQDVVPGTNTMCDSADDNNLVHGDDENVQMDELPKAKEVQVPAEGGLVEENEKLRVAVEELMKAGKEQLGMIRELTGRVKDLEKKLSKKKKIKVNKCRRSRGGCVVQKD